MGDGSQKFKGMPLFLQGINFRISPAQHFNFIGFELHLLAFSLGRDKGSGRHNGATGLQFKYIIPVVGQFLIRNDLQARQA